VPAKKTTRKVTAKSVPARKTTARKTTARKTTAKRKTTTGKVTAKTVPAKKTTAKPRQGSTAARPGDVIVIDSAQVGSPAREGEVLQVIYGEVNVSYRVQWADGHQTLISPMSGTARIIQTTRRA
jgi:hypothetical protein